MKKSADRKKKQRPGKLPLVLLVIVVAAAALGMRFSGDAAETAAWKRSALVLLEEGINRTLFPASDYDGESLLPRKKKWEMAEAAERAISEMETDIESSLSYEQIIKNEAQDEDEPPQETATQAEVKKQEEENQLSQAKVVEYSDDRLQDFDYLLSNFYLVDKTTTISPSLLNVSEMLAKDLTMKKDDEGNIQTAILLYHTHSQEGYADHVEGDKETSVVGVGNYLAELLEEKGFTVIHDTGEYDLEGRSSAYTRAAEALEPLLAQHPEVEVIIDLHRDGVADTVHMTTEVNGKVSAPIMFFNGLSYTTSTGSISYLPNPYIADNLALSFQLQLAAAEYYPGFTRPIYLKGYRYNMHYLPKSILVEVGAQTNTTEEAKNAMEPFAELLYHVLAGK